MTADLQGGCCFTFFFVSSLQGSFYVPSENCLQRAHTWHRRLCRLLLVAHRGLHTYHTALLKEIPQLPQTPLDSGGHVAQYEKQFSCFTLCLTALHLFYM